MVSLVPRRVLILSAGVAAVAAIFAGTARSASLTRSEASLLRVMNQVRGAHGLRPLRFDPRLERASRRHSTRMLQTQTFFHGNFVARIRGVGVRAPRVGENLAWAAGPLSAAQAIVNMWLASPEHRANLLRGGYRTVGVGARRGTFDGYPGALMVTTDFAGR
jgi:uncharacterized protein YkwD